MNPYMAKQETFGYGQNFTRDLDIKKGEHALIKNQVELANKNSMNVKLPNQKSPIAVNNRR